MNVTAADVYTIELSPNPASVQVGKTVTLTPTVKKNGSVYNYTGSFTWSSSVTDKATVSNGVVTGVAPGSSTVIAKATIEGKTIEGTATVNVTAADVYTIELSPNPASVQVGNTVTLTPTVKKNGSVYNYTGSFTWSSSATGKATVNNGVVTGVAAGSSTITAKATIEGKTIEGTATVNVTEKEPIGTEYQNVSVTLTATPSSIAASGGSSTLSASGTWQERTKYSDGTYSSWTSKSTTNFSDFTISGSATGFTRNGANVTVAANTGAARSVTYTAKLTKGSVTGSGEATITQAAYVPDDHFEWIDTEISVDAGGTATAQFYSSTNSASISSYTTSVIDGVTISSTYTPSGNSDGRKYKGTATIRAKSTAGGTSGTVTGAVGSSNDQLKVTVERPYYIIGIVIEGPSEITPEYPQNVQYNCIVRARTPQGTKTFYSNRNPEYFTWSSEQFTLVSNDTGTFNVRSATAGTLKCTFNYSGELSGTADYFVKQVNSATQPEYEYVSAETKFVKNWSDGRAEWKVVVKMRESGTSNYAYIDLTSSSFAGNNELRAVWEWNYANNVWQTGDHLIPSGAQFRVKVYYKDSLMWTSQVHNN